MANGLVHFEIHASDPEKLAEFYRNLFGWTITKYEGIPGLEYWGVMTCSKGAPNAINGGLIRRKGPSAEVGAPVNGFVCTMQIDDIDEMIKKAEDLGCKVAMPKYALAGMAWMAYMIDPDNNIFGLHQVDPNAK